MVKKQLGDPRLHAAGMTNFLRRAHGVDEGEEKGFRNLTMPEALELAMKMKHGDPDLPEAQEEKSAIAQCLGTTGSRIAHWMPSPFHKWEKLTGWRRLLRALLGMTELAGKWLRKPKRFRKNKDPRQHKLALRRPKK